MNERIKQLKEQSMEWVPNQVDPDTKIRLLNAGKFAELIVAECTALLFDESERLSGLYSEEDNWNSAEEYEIRSNQCVDDIALIEKHFGVEE
jgi:hypothetical protein